MQLAASTQPGPENAEAYQRAVERSVEISDRLDGPGPIRKGWRTRRGGGNDGSPYYVETYCGSMEDDEDEEAEDLARRMRMLQKEAKTKEKGDYGHATGHPHEAPREEKKSIVPPKGRPKPPSPIRTA